MSHVLAVLGLAAACVAWLLVQRWTGADDALACGRRGEGCGACGQPGEACSREPDPQ
jgi:hypothetical protein